MEVEFDYFKDWAMSSLKLDLNSYKERQLHRRIETVRKNAGANNLKEYTRLLDKDENLKRLFLDYITINVTEFFRNKEIFDDFENLLKERQGTFNDMKIWSAACSIGAEPYSIAIIMERHKMTRGKILATDIDDPILDRARAGIFKEPEMKNVSLADKQTFFTNNEGDYHVKDVLKKRVTFKKHDLLLDPYEKNFQAIVCRNVTIYFKNEAKNEVYKKFHEALVPGGIFFTGATEAIYNPTSIGFKKISTFLYEKI